LDASVVPARSAPPMRSAIDDLVGGRPLGETEIGKAWCLKALHPAETSIISSPMPTRETRSFATVAFQQLNMLSMPSTFSTSKPYNLTIYFHRDPTLLFSYKFTQSGSGDVTGYVHSNQIANSTHYAEHVALRANCERFRLTSSSISAYFDGASETDQGHVVCGQTDLPRLVIPVLVPATDLPVNDFGARLSVCIYQDDPPAMEQIVQTTRPYQGPANRGVYCPSKLQSLGAWVTTNVSYFLPGSSTPTTPVTPGCFPFSDLGGGSYFADQPSSDFQGTFPYMWTAGGGAPRTFAQTDSTLTSIFFTGIAPTTTVRVTTRWTLDMVVRPGTPYAPFVRMPPVEDLPALKMYSEISRRLADGYPSSYNNLGFLLPLIGKIASTIGPVILPRLFETIKNRVEQQLRAGKVSMFESVVAPPLSEADTARATALAAKMERTPEEQAELEALAARATPSVLPQVGAAATALLSRLGKYRAKRYENYYRNRYSRRKYYKKYNYGGGGYYERRSKRRKQYY